MQLDTEKVQFCSRVRLSLQFQSPTTGCLPSLPRVWLRAPELAPGALELRTVLLNLGRDVVTAAPDKALL